ncbi:succinate dehydrogenase/fumarate reductase iron-sulfur subunit [Lujinxingia litoralis]|uniref:succinate dehydrogenase n=2 Tax=Lujinxingia litoralis TaxID=2211119 RepID=A0A328C7L0_9DELT|nr:succinate dehydrogenase/fumarate reductase iron-sulfur subunit [Lujinxingia litoralis]
MTVHLKVWRQAGPDVEGRFESYSAEINPHMSFLEMLDVVNEDLIKKGEMPIEFDNDCREGICGTCGCVVNGQAHGLERGTTVCQLHMRSFRDGETIVIEPWRAEAFPVIRDLVVDRGAFDRIISAGGYVSVNTGPKPDANAVKIGKDLSDKAFDSAACIGCGACVAACPNASASLFTGAKITQLALMPQGAPERGRRVRAMVDQMDAEGFGNCSNIGECEAACPKEISLDNIATMKREYLRAMFTDN